MIALLLVIAALVAVAILGTVLLTRDDARKVSQEDMVRTTIQNFDTAIQKGDLATLRSITCGETATATSSTTTHVEGHPRPRRGGQAVPRGRQHRPGGRQRNHAEANVTTFMAFDPSTRSTRSFDLEFRDEQWKICQAAG